MDEGFPAVRKGLLEFAVLKVIAGERVYAADILARLAGAEFATQEGTLYPLLAKLRREEMVDHDWVESDAGPPRKYYSLTAKGTAQLESLSAYWRRLNAALDDFGAMNMERVVTINLNGNAYQLDESAFDVLGAYLARAAAALAGNPDKDEIIRDLEQAIADKAGAYLSAGKSVLSKTEVERIIAQMGPVEGEGAAQDGDAPHPDNADDDAERPRKRLYRLRDDAVIAGVCSGMAAYFDIDVWIVRLIWILAAVFTGGGVIVVYLVLMFVIPSANTSAEWAEARGLPHTAHGVVEEAKKRYAEFEERGGVRAEMRRGRRAWRRWRRRQGDFFYGPPPGAPPGAAPVKPAGYFTRFFAGLIAFVFSVIGAALTLAFLITLVTLATTGAVFGWTPPGDLPLWLSIVILCIVFAAISGPFRAIRMASYATVRGYPYYHRGEGWNGFATIALVLVLGWLAWQYVPAANEWMSQIPNAVNAVVNDISN